MTVMVISAASGRPNRRPGRPCSDTSSPEPLEDRDVETRTRFELLCGPVAEGPAEGALPPADLQVCGKPAGQSGASWGKHNKINDLACKVLAVASNELSRARVPVPTHESAWLCIGMDDHA